MGAGQSGGVEIGGSSMGYQVLRVYPNSPGSRAGLKAYFDFIVAIGTTRFNKENGSLRELLKASVDQKLKMIVFNTRTKSTREVEIIPSTSWGGNGLLGVSIKHSSFDRADERVWHVTEVEPGSPAQQAGFKANEDYVIGSDSILQESDDLYNLVEAHEGKALKLFVYNVNSDNCREVICHPNSRWGGKGYLGCEFGHGLLHRIPYTSSGGDTNSVRAPLLRNEQPMGVAQQMPQQTNSHSFQNHMMQQQLNQLQKPTQPGQQLLQRALLDPTPLQEQSQKLPQYQQPHQPSAQQQVPQYQQPQQIPQYQQLQQLTQLPQQHQPSQYQQQQQLFEHQQPQQLPEYQHPQQTTQHQLSQQLPQLPQQLPQLPQQLPQLPQQLSQLPQLTQQHQIPQYQQQQQLLEYQQPQQPPECQQPQQLPEYQQPQQPPEYQQPQQQQQLPPPPQVPQTFAQLASAQYQM